MFLISTEEIVKDFLSKKHKPIKILKKAFIPESIKISRYNANNCKYCGMPFGYVYDKPETYNSKKIINKRCINCSAEVI